MGIKRGIEVALIAVLAFVLASCGGSSGSNSNSSQTSNPVSISFQSPPPASLTSSTTQLTAVVKNDPANYGVDWCLAVPGYSCGATCPPNQCGTLSSPHTDSGQPVTYAAPTTVPGNGETVNIVAFATADHNKNVTAAIALPNFNSRLKGTFVFHAKGSDTLNPTAESYQVAGAVSLDGNGGMAVVNVNGRMLAGEQTYTDSIAAGSAHITGGSYSVHADGRGILTLVTDNANIGIAGTETFSIVSISNSQALIAEVDQFAFASGAMDLQTATTAPTGGYAFALTGTDSNSAPTAVGGVFNIDQPNGVISGNKSVADQASNGSVLNCPAPTAAGAAAGLTGTVSAPDTFGAVQLNLTTCFSASPMQLTGYLVDGGHLQLIEFDINPGVAGYAVGGVALSQGTAPLTSGATAFSGKFVFGISGLDTSGSPSSLTSAGLLTSDGAGKVSGTSDEITTGMAIADTYSGNYTVDASGTGRVDAPLTFANNASLSAPEFIFYLTGSGTPLVVLMSDPVAQTVGTGIVYPQTPSPFAFSGKYGFSALNLSQANSLANADVSGQMTVDATANNLAGWIDFGFGNLLDGNPTPFTGTFGAVSNTGRFSGTLITTGTGIATPAAVEFYLIDSGHGFFIETDMASPLLLGYFAAQTPLCPTCQ